MKRPMSGKQRRYLFGAKKRVVIPPNRHGTVSTVRRDVNVGAMRRGK